MRACWLMVLIALFLEGNFEVRLVPNRTGSRQFINRIQLNLSQLLKAPFKRVVKRNVFCQSILWKNAIAISAGQANDYDNMKRKTRNFSYLTFHASAMIIMVVAATPM